MEAKGNSLSKFCDGVAQTIEASRLYEAIAKDKEISSISLKKEDRVFSENGEDRVHLVFKTYFPEFYLTAEGNSIFVDISTVNTRREKH